MYPDCPLIEIIDFGSVDFWARSSAFLWSPWHHRCGSMERGKDWDGTSLKVNQNILNTWAKKHGNPWKMSGKAFENWWTSMEFKRKKHWTLWTLQVMFQDVSGFCYINFLAIGQSPFWRIVLPLGPPILGDFPLPRLITGGYTRTHTHIWWSI